MKLYKTKQGAWIHKALLYFGFLFVASVFIKEALSEVSDASTLFFAGAATILYGISIITFRVIESIDDDEEDDEITPFGGSAL